LRASHASSPPLRDTRDSNVFRKYSVRNSTSAPAILTEVFSGFIQFLWEKAAIVPQITPRRLPFTNFQILRSQIIPPFHATQLDRLKESRIKPRNQIALLFWVEDIQILGKNLISALIVLQIWREMYFISKVNRIDLERRLSELRLLIYSPEEL
jgi:hypothetical protein